jgi:hypothetical protein
MKRFIAILAGSAAVLLGFHLGQSHAQRLLGRTALENRSTSPAELDVDCFFECVRVFKPAPAEGPIALIEYEDRNRTEFWELYRSQLRKRSAPNRDESRDLPTPTAANVRTAAIRTRDAARKDFLEHLLGPVRAKCPRLTGPYCLPSLTRALQAEIDLAATKQDREKTLWEYWTIFKYLEAQSTAQYESGGSGPANHFPVVHARLKVEYELVKSLSN